MKRSPIQRRTPLRQKSLMNRGKPLRKRRSTGRPTVAEKLRFAAMAELPCLACHINPRLGLWQTGMRNENHHLLSGGRRIGHMATVRLCHHHHQGKFLPGDYTSYLQASAVYGPSLERESKVFAATYGSDEQLLAMQNEMLTELENQK